MITFLEVPFSDKEIARKLGARWSPGNQCWYVENVEDLEPFLRWMHAHHLKPVKPSARIK